MMSGFYLMHRGWQDNTIFKDEPYTEREAWEWIIANAAWKECRVRIKNIVVTVQRGQVAASLRYMAEKWQWQEPRVRRFLGRLEKAEMIKCVADAGVNVVTVCNYEEYQAPQCVDDAQTDAASTQDRRSIDANKKEDNKDKELPLEAGASRGVVADDDEPPSIPLEKPDAVPVETLKAMASIWREVCGDVLPVPRALDKTRQAALRRRFLDTFGRDIDQWRKFCERVRGSPFLTGDNANGWRADLDFMLKPKNANKLLEGGYDDRKPRQAAAQQHRPAAHSTRPSTSDILAGVLDAVDTGLQRH